MQKKERNEQQQLPTRLAKYGEEKKPLCSHIYIYALIVKQR